MDLLRFRKFFGLASIIIFLLSTVLAAINYPNYNPNTNYLSDLGVGEESAFYFNSGLILTGILGIFFGSTLMKLSEKPLQTIGYLFYIFASITLILVGTFTETSNLHEIVSVVFFILSAISFVLVGYSIKPKTAGYISFLAAIPILIFPLTGSLPIFEHIAVLSIGFWILYFSIYFNPK